MPEHDPLPLDMRVGRCEPYPIAVRVPLPVDRALDLVVDQLADSGTSTTRSELIAALIAQASINPRAARRAVAHYRVLNVGALIGAQAGSGPVRLVKASRGRPSGREERTNRWQTIHVTEEKHTHE